jgi:hypothetical protein
VRGFILGLALVQFAMPFVRICAGEAQINAYLTNDDTYYYLQTAWNARHLGFVTFDGINATNGVQFLWFSILYGLTFLTSDKSAFLALASSVAIALTCVPYLVMWRLSRERSIARASLVAVCMAFFWFLICAYRPNRYLTGLESPLHAAIIWMIVFQYLQIRRRLARGALRPSSVLLFAALLVMNTWTRLDSFGLSASFLALLVLTVDGPLHPTTSKPFFAKSLPVATYAAGALIVVSGAAALFAFFRLAGGSWMPVSALVKGYQVDRFSLGAFYNWSLVLFPLRIQGANLLNILGIVAMFASVWKLLNLKVADGNSDWAALRLVAIALAASVFIHSLATFGMFRYYYFWYLSGTFTYWTIVAAIFLVEMVERREWRFQYVAATGFLVAVSLVAFWRVQEQGEHLALTRYQAAKWMDRNLEADAIVGSFNSGQLGFFSGRSVVNLDGLINSATYFENILKDPSPEALSTYMDRIGVDYVVDYALGRWREPIERDFTTIRQFDLAVGGSLRVMKRVSRTSRREPATSNAAAISPPAGR